MAKAAAQPPPRDWTPRPLQQQVLDTLSDHGGVIELRPGGWWTYPDCRPGHPRRPSWRVGWNTVAAMERHGWLRRAGLRAEAWHDARVLTDEGRARAHPERRRGVSVNCVRCGGRRTGLDLLCDECREEAAEVRLERAVAAYVEGAAWGPGEGPRERELVAAHLRAFLRGQGPRGGRP